MEHTLPKVKAIFCFDGNRRLFPVSKRRNIPLGGKSTTCTTRCMLLNFYVP